MYNVISSLLRASRLGRSLNARGSVNSYNRLGVSRLRSAYLSGRSPFGGRRTRSFRGRYKAVLMKKRRFGRSTRSGARGAKRGRIGKRFRRMGAARRLRQKRKQVIKFSRLMSEPKRLLQYDVGSVSCVGALPFDTNGGLAILGSHQSHYLFQAISATMIRKMWQLAYETADGTGGAGFSSTAKFLAKSFTCSLQLRNNFSQDCEIRLWMLWPRRDTSIVTAAHYTTSTPATASAWDFCPNMQITAGVAALNPVFPRQQDAPGGFGANNLRDYHYEWDPFEDLAFRTLFTIKRVGTHRLSPGDSRSVNFGVKNKLFSKTTLGLNLASDWSACDKIAMRGIPLLMVSVRGTLVHDESQKALLPVGPINSTFGQCMSDFNVDFVMRRHGIACRYLELAASSIEAADITPLGKASGALNTSTLNQWHDVNAVEQAPVV